MSKQNNSNSNGGDNNKRRRKLKPWQHEGAKALFTMIAAFLCILFEVDNGVQWLAEFVINGVKGNIVWAGKISSFFFTATLGGFLVGALFTFQALKSRSK